MGTICGKLNSAEEPGSTKLTLAKSLSEESVAIPAARRFSVSATRPSTPHQSRHSSSDNSSSDDIVTHSSIRIVDPRDDSAPATPLQLLHRVRGCNDADVSAGRSAVGGTPFPTRDSATFHSLVSDSDSEPEQVVPAQASQRRMSTPYPVVPRDVSMTGTAAAKTATTQQPLLSTSSGLAPPTSCGRYKRCNSTSSVYLTDSLCAPDDKAMLRSLSEFLCSSMVIDSEPDVRRRRSNHSNPLRPSAYLRRRLGEEDAAELDELPEVEEVFEFVSHIFTHAQMTSETTLMAVVYLERAMASPEKPITLTTSNWRQFTFIAMMMSSKVWDDLSMVNGDFAYICSYFTVSETNAMEVCLLESLSWNIFVSSSEYARVFFKLRNDTPSGNEQEPEMLRSRPQKRISRHDLLTLSDASDSQLSLPRMRRTRTVSTREDAFSTGTATVV